MCDVQLAPLELWWRAPLELKGCVLPLGCGWLQVGGPLFYLVLGVLYKYQWYCCSLVVRDSTDSTSGSSPLFLGARHYFLQEGFSF